MSATDVSCHGEKWIILASRVKYYARVMLMFSKESMIKLSLKHDTPRGLHSLFVKFVPIQLQIIVTVQHLLLIWRIWFALRSKYCWKTLVHLTRYYAYWKKCNMRNTMWFKMLTDIQYVWAKMSISQNQYDYMNRWLSCVIRYLHSDWGTKVHESPGVLMFTIWLDMNGFETSGSCSLVGMLGMLGHFKTLAWLQGSQKKIQWRCIQASEAKAIWSPPGGRMQHRS